MSARRNSKRRQRNFPPRNVSPGWTGTFWLVVVDDAPLRQEAAAACRHRFQHLKNAREEWHRFERHDRPAFERWSSSTFGPQLTELRVAKDRLVELDRLVTEVETESFMMNCSPKAAYRRIIRARSMPPPPVSDSPLGDQDETNFADDDGGDKFFGGEDMDDFTKEILFRDFVSDVMQTDPEEIPRPIYDALFEQFKAMHFGPSHPGEAPPPQNSESRGRPSTPTASVPARIKDLYRQLVRRLHPDARESGGPETMHLWHEVQDAYTAGDLERMEMLGALTDIHEGTIGRHTPLSRLREALREIEGALRALGKSLRAARKAPEWDFTRRGPTPLLHRRFSEKIGAELREIQTILADYEGLVVQWQQPPKKKKRVQRPTARVASEEPLTQGWMQF